MNGIGAHQSPKMKTDVWLTPRPILDRLGEFDLDPCCPPVMPWRTARVHYTKAEDGLTSPWFGRVWLNPPYNSGVIDWMRKLAKHGRGTALVFARTETEWFFETVWRRARAVLFIEGRLHFCHENGVQAKNNAGGPSCLAAYGEEDAEALDDSLIAGKFVRL